MKTKKKNIYTRKLIREYNEDMHPGYDLQGEDLYTLDESELEEFENWIKRNKKS